MALSLRESILVSISDFWSRKLRSFITIFSIILGTLTIVVVQSLVEGVKESTLAWMMERGGVTRLDIRRNWEYQNPRNLNTFLTLREFEDLKRRLPEVKSISPEMMTYGRVSSGNKSMNISLAGILPDFVETENWGADRGRFINNFDLTQRLDTIIIGSAISDELFGNTNPIGKFVTFQNRRFQVVGVMSYRYFVPQGGVMSSNMLEYLNRRAFIPITTMVNKLAVEDRINNITVQAVSVEQAKDLKDEISYVLRTFRNNEPVFTVDSALEESEASQAAAKIFQIVFFIISSISLLVAGIVIMNIMMASVKERTREIGIRMAVGAGRIDIFLQFIIQTLAFTLIGGFLGVITGLSILEKVGEYIGFNMVGGVTLVVISLSVSTLVGLVFGILPAIKASNLDPVKCLAYE